MAFDRRLFDKKGFSCLHCTELLGYIDRLHAYVDELETRVVSPVGWKGQDFVEYSKVDDDYWVVKEHRKQKVSGVVDEATHIVRHIDVVRLASIVINLCDVGVTTSYRAVVREILRTRKIKAANIESFNGGVNRAKYYFPFYYYPMKILEYIGFVEYGGRGVITRRGANV